VPDLTGYITEGQIVLSGELHARGIYPPVDALSSLSRLMRHGAGAGKTRDDHLDVAAQTLSALAASRRARELAELIGTAAFSESDRTYTVFENEFEHLLVSQGPAESRMLDQTLRRAWQVLGVLPRRELTMIWAASPTAGRTSGRRTRPARHRLRHPTAPACGGRQARHLAARIGFPPTPGKQAPDDHPGWLHVQFRISGMSWPWVLMYWLCSTSLSCIACFR
jgi:hypothetical protein